MEVLRSFKVLRPWEFSEGVFWDTPAFYIVTSFHVYRREREAVLVRAVDVLEMAVAGLGACAKPAEKGLTLQHTVPSWSTMKI